MNIPSTFSCISSDFEKSTFLRNKHFHLECKVGIVGSFDECTSCFSVGRYFYVNTEVIGKKEADFERLEQSVHILFCQICEK